MITRGAGCARPMSIAPSYSGRPVPLSSSFCVYRSPPISSQKMVKGKTKAANRAAQLVVVTGLADHPLGSLHKQD